jgi:hypothetical protein
MELILSQLSIKEFNQNTETHKITGTLLQLFSGIINNLSWIIYPENKKIFAQYKLVYDKFSAIHRKLHAHYQAHHSFATVLAADEKTYQQCAGMLVQANIILTAQLTELLEQVCRKIRVEHVACIAQVRSIQQQLVNLHSQENRDAIAEIFKALELQISAIKKTQVKTDNLESAAILEQGCLALKTACFSFKFPHRSATTDATPSQELIAASRLLKIDVLADYYAALKKVWLARWQQHLPRLDYLTKNFQTSWREAIRLQRMIDCKLQWIKHLRASFQEYQKSPTWEATIKLTLLMTEGKSAFFKHFVETQPADFVLATVYRKLKCKLTLSDWYDKNKTLQIEIKNLEQTITADRTIKQKFLLIFTRNLKILLDANLGRTTSQISQALVHKTTTASEPWPPSWTPYIEYGSTLLCLLIDLGFMRFTGSSYYMLSTLSRGALVYQDTWGPIPQRLDQIFCSRQRYEFFRLDELGLFEKRDAIQWILSLVIHLSLCLLTGCALIPAAVGYCLATSLKHIATKAIMIIGKYRQWSTQEIALASQCMGILSYTFGYRLSANLPKRFFINDPRNHALDVLGLPPDANSTAIRDRYLFLIGREHPDHKGDPQKAVEINEAYATLKL